METGFYNTEILSRSKQLRFMKEAIFLSYKINIQSKYIREGARTEEPNITIKQALQLCNDLKAVDRSIQHGSLTKYGEVTFITTDFTHPTIISSYGKGWLLLYCFLSIENLDALTKKYGITKQ